MRKLEELGQKFSVPIGFYITPSWKGDITAFQDFLSQNGFQEAHRLIPHVLDDLSVADNIKPSAFKVDIANDDDHDIVATIFHEVFKGDDAYAQMIRDKLKKNDGPVKTTFFLARDADGTPAGIAACNHDGTFGYMNCLAVREPYRLQGLASHLVKIRLNYLRDHNTRYAVTIVAWKNTASLNTQAKIGYRKLIEASVWKPKDSAYHKTI